MKSSKSPRRESLSARLVLLTHLLDGRRWSQKELMEYLGVDRKTIVSNIDALSQPGLPQAVLEEREGRHVYRLKAAYIAT
jgi:predicted DNA-binding transcriptional regulator YafY